MQIFKYIQDLQDYLNQNTNKTIGFVPTMGALHEGHLSLIEASNRQCDITICSIFVNPVQFNRQNDFDNYPKTFTSDSKKLITAKCDVLFCPSVNEMYPVKVEKYFEFGPMAELMEGRHRPGHFNGVAIVIERFFEIIDPDYAYFGEKDFQQLAVVKDLCKQIGSKTQIIGAPIIRESSGLAMSSRNLRLSEDEKIAAANISEELKYICNNAGKYSIDELLNNYKKNIDANTYLVTEYIEIADGNTMLPIRNWEDSNYLVVFTAVNVGEVRLIDNMTIIN